MMKRIFKPMMTRSMVNGFLAGFLFLQIILGFAGQSILLPTVAHAQLNTDTSAVSNVPTYSGVDKSISQYLCTPDDSNLGTSLFTCINKVYRFGVAFGAIALVFFVVFAGYMYIAGGESSKAKGKSMFISALTGMVIILSSYVLLSFINPDLVKIKPIQAPIFSASDLPSCADVGFGVNCMLPDGQISTNGGTGVAGSASEAKYKDLIASNASANGLEYCALSALIEKESSFTYNIYSSPDYVVRFVNISNGPPSYGISYPTYHAIGLTQVTIYPQNKGGWVGDTPARSDPGSFGKSPLTMQMLLDPATNIEAGAHFFGKLLKSKGSLQAAYNGYFGGPAPDITQKYNNCKARSK